MGNYKPQLFFPHRREGCLVTTEGKVLARWSPSSLRTRPGSGGTWEQVGHDAELTAEEGAGARNSLWGRMETLSFLTWGSLGSKGLLSLWFQADLDLRTNCNCVTLGKSHSLSEPWFFLVCKTGVTTVRIPKSCRGGYKVRGVLGSAPGTGQALHGSEQHGPPTLSPVDPEPLAQRQGRTACLQISG